VDASRWRYVLHDLGDGVFELTVYALFTEDLDDNLREAAVEIVLQGVLGEMRRFVKLERIKLTLDPDQPAAPITALAHHIDDLVRQIAPC